MDSCYNLLGNVVISNHKGVHYDLKKSRSFYTNHEKKCSLFLTTKELKLIETNLDHFVQRMRRSQLAHSTPDKTIHGFSKLCEKLSLCMASPYFLS